MCGICGIFNIDGNPVASELIHAMNTTMIHRGPDGDGIFVDKGVGLGHRRLSIIDLNTGDQPMSSSDGRVTVVFNGEIYNFQELKKILEKKGHRFKTRSDTEVIIYAYVEWGQAFVNKLRGMFAIALWDKRLKALFLARDRVGKKPLYYCYDGKKFVFASELKAVLEVPGISRQMDFKALDAYFSFGYVPSPMSILKGIRKLKPGHIAWCSSKGFAEEEYWDINMNGFDHGMTEETAIERLTELFDEAVGIRLVSDVPLGAFLSGGVDSSAVVASMAGLLDGKPVKTSSIGFCEKKFNELEFAEIVSKMYSTDHREAVVTTDALDVIDKIVWHFDEPFADSSAIPTWYVSKITRQNVTVALSGDGGDETFAGYVQRYGMNRFEDNIRKTIPSFIRNTLIRGMASVYPRIDALPRPLRLKAFLTNLSLSMEQAYYRDMSFYFSPENKKFLYNSDMKNAVDGYSSFFVFEPFFRRNTNPDPVTTAQYVDIKTYMTEDILVKVDRMSMAHSLEVRSPILDHKLMEFAATLPSGLKLNHRESKYILKKVNEKRLPHNILYRKKQGFSVPLAQWIRQNLRGYVQAALFDSKNNVGEYLSIKYVKKLWEDHLKGMNDHSSQIWNIFMFELWRRRFL
ncbi:asparagine synthase (glutamine-hydrolyzing) [Desulfobacula phenolica]|uniref:asparagine synthase (glutamine-hydrolyzing) n=1 Tax=Desulfobacula phenolica TaxID=90732 RepID=A0A1H2EPJ3_9BACT|nr:asparagine synthase (glutamine-hydrolyzing) [Desulfobacula phenolica]SDT97047.1 asparagine synthase (glutamine-hydrolysing) [Desulfobacula phenolica]